MLLELEDVPAANRTARYRSVIVFIANADDPAPLVGEGIWEGDDCRVRREAAEGSAMTPSSFRAARC